MVWTLVRYGVIVLAMMLFVFAGSFGFYVLFALLERRREWRRLKSIRSGRYYAR